MKKSLLFFVKAVNNVFQSKWHFELHAVALLALKYNIAHIYQLYLECQMEYVKYTLPYIFIKMIKYGLSNQQFAEIGKIRPKGLLWNLQENMGQCSQNVHMYFRVYSMGYMLVDLLLCTYMKQEKLCFIILCRPC